MTYYNPDGSLIGGSPMQPTRPIVPGVGPLPAPRGGDPRGNLYNQRPPMTPATPSWAPVWGGQRAPTMPGSSPMDARALLAALMGTRGMSQVPGQGPAGFNPNALKTPKDLQALFGGLPQMGPMFGGFGGGYGSRLGFPMQKAPMPNGMPQFSQSLFSGMGGLMGPRQY